MTLRIIESLRQRGSQIFRQRNSRGHSGYIEQILPNANPRLRPLPDRPKVILMVGVNGTGKNDFHREACSSAPPRETHCDVWPPLTPFGQRPLATQDLGRTSQCRVIASEYQADPSALCFDAYSAAHKRNIEFLICDTAAPAHETQFDAGVRQNRSYIAKT